MPFRLRCLLATGLLLLSGCAPPPHDLGQLRGRFGGTLRLAAENDLRTLDTAIGYDSPSWRFERLIFEGLLNYDDDATLVPAVAESLPEIVGGRLFRFRLRDDVTFHHGRRVVAEDFKYAVERVLTPSTRSPAASFFTTLVGAEAFVAGAADEVTGIRCADSRTIEFELTEPDVAFLNVLTMPFAYPIPREVVERYTNPETGESQWAEHAIGCGPYRLAEWVRGIRIRVERYDGYYRDDVGFVDAIEQQFGIPEFMQLMMFERGEIDASGLPLPDFERITGDPAMQPRLRAMPENATYYCSMNTELPPFDRQPLRQAFNFAVDKQRIKRIMNGTVEPATGVLPPGMPGFDPARRGYPHDPDRAKRLLAEAGYPDGLDVTLMTRSNPRENAFAQAIQQDLGAVGVRVSLDAVAFPKWLDMSGHRGEVPFTINAWFQDYPDPSNFLEVLLAGERITEYNCTNRSFYSNPEVNRLLAQARAMTDLEARLKVYQRAEDLIVDDAPWLFLFYPTRYVLVQPWVQNYRLHPVWSSRDERVWLAPVEEGANLSS